MAFFRIQILAFGCAVALCGCLGEVEHSNPLDPNAPGFDSVGTISGQTTRYYPPFTAVQDADVQLGGHAVRSDEDGRFVFRNVPAGEYFLSAKADGFKSPVDTVTVALGTSVDELSVRLDGLPVILYTAVRSVRISRWFPTEDLFMLDVVAIVEDPDGISDIDSVWFEIPAQGFESGLDDARVAGRFEDDLNVADLSVESLYALQGSEFLLFAQDQVGFVVESDPTHIFRVIDYTPVAVEPQGQITLLDNTPTLSWEDAALPYPYTYQLDVFRDQANVQTRVDQITDIPADQLSYELETPLPAGTYFWTVWVVDQHGNRSRSKEAGFIIE